MNLRHVARWAACVALHASGACALSRALRRRRGAFRVVVLAYHSFDEGLPYLDMSIPSPLFMRQVEEIARVSLTMTLREWIQARSAGRLPAADVTIVTVDDGYADNLLPLLEAIALHGVRSTLFVTTGGDGDVREPTAILRAIRAIDRARVESIEMPSLGVGRMPLRNRHQREAAIAAIDRALRPLPADRRATALAELERQCGVESAPPAAMLRWSELARLRDAGVEIGAHTVDHPVLARCDEPALRRQIEESVERVRALGERGVTFAYPYGGEDDVDPRVRRACRESGALAAVTLTPHGRIDDTFAIPRTMVTADRSTDPWGRFSRAVWACELEGMLDAPRAVLSSLRRRGPARAEAPA